MSPLEREGRENDIDEFVVPGLSIEGMDYKTYLQKLQGGGQEDYKHQDYDAKSERGRTKKVTIVTTEEIWRLLRIVAALDGKTVSTYLNDFILSSLKEQLKQASCYSKFTDVNYSG